jgi:hypothetical protein
MSDALATRRTASFAALLAMMVIGVAALAAGPARSAPGAAAAKPKQAGAKQKPKPANAKSLPVEVTGTGIVQTVYRRGVIVRELDGRIVRVPVVARTRVFVDGVRSSLADVEPGFVATFAGRGKVVRVLRAVDPSPPEPRKGIATVTSVSPDEVVVSRGTATLTLRVDARTRVFVDGTRAALADVSPGDLVAVAAGAGAAQRPVAVLRVRRPG